MCRMNAMQRVVTNGLQRIHVIAREPFFPGTARQGRCGERGKLLRTGVAC
jgi:hypothetical protein